MTRTEKLRRARELTHEIRDMLISEHIDIENRHTLLRNLYNVEIKLKEELHRIQASLLESWDREFDRDVPVN